MSYRWFKAKVRESQTPEVGELDKFDRFDYIEVEKLGEDKLSPNMQNLAKKLKDNKMSII